jgi:hypothetical protein
MSIIGLVIVLILSFGIHTFLQGVLEMPMWAAFIVAMLPIYFLVKVFV